MVVLSCFSANIGIFSKKCGPSAISRFFFNFCGKKNSLEYLDLVWNALNMVFNADTRNTVDQF